MKERGERPTRKRQRKEKTTRREEVYVLLYHTVTWKNLAIVE